MVRYTLGPHQAGGFFMDYTVKQATGADRQKALAATDMLTYDEYRSDSYAVFMAEKDDGEVIGSLVLDPEYANIHEIWVRKDLQYTEVGDKLVWAAKELLPGKTLTCGFEAGDNFMSLLLARCGGAAKWVTYEV